MYVGMLSHWVQNSMQDESNVDFLLVDRASTRYKVPELVKCSSYENGVYIRILEKEADLDTRFI